MVNQSDDSRDQAIPVAVSSSNSQATSLSLLNFDVLHQAMSHLEFAGDIVRTMETCHSLHYAGVPILLRIPVRLFTMDRVVSFHQFMFGTKADKDRRFKHLRHFEYAYDTSFGVSTWEEMSISLDRIAEILRNSHNLESLHLRVRQELLKPALRDALERLPCLRTLIVHETGAYMMEILTGIRAPVTHMELDFNPSFNNTLPLDTLLRNFSTSLRHLNMSYPMIHISDIQCPQVHTLEVSFPQHLVPPFTRHLVHTFPNVVKVVLSGVYDDFREENLQAVAALHLPWPKLEFLGGDLSSLDNLGLSSPTRYLDIHEVMPLDTTFPLLIQDLQPICLDVDLGQLSTWFDNDHREEDPPRWNTDLLSGVFVGMAELSRLTHLILGLTFSWLHVPVIDVFKRFAASMRGSHITFLALYLIGERRNKRPMDHIPLTRIHRKDTLGLADMVQGGYEPVAFFWSVQRLGCGDVFLEERDTAIALAMMEMAREISATSVEA